MTAPIQSDDYRQWISSIKQRVQSAQIKASVAINRELLELYWFLGEQILEKQQAAGWGDRFLEQMSQDLLKEFPKTKGFSRRNLFYMRKWVIFWSGTERIVQQAAAQSSEIVQQVVAQLQSRPNRNASRSIGQQVVAENAPQLVAQIPWGHNLVLLDKFEHANDALFYVKKTIENNWSRSVLTHQIESGLHLREGKAISNFAATLPTPNSDLAHQMLRDPYQFDFLTLTDRYTECELENGLVEHLTRFLKAWSRICIRRPSVPIGSRRGGVLR